MTWHKKSIKKIIVGIQKKWEEQTCTEISWAYTKYFKTFEGIKDIEGSDWTDTFRKFSHSCPCP